MVKTRLITFKVTDAILIDMDKHVKSGAYNGRSPYCRDAIEEFIEKEQLHDRAVPQKNQEVKL